MCLYPRLIENRKYRVSKKNGGVIPPKLDQRVTYVPIGCQVCIECRKQKSREWLIRLSEDIKEYTNGKFVTLTFSTEALKKIIAEDKEPKERKRKNAWKDLKKAEGYELDNGIATKAVRLFLERWRKEYKKSLRHWLITELGGGHTEHIHLHGIVWTDKPEELERIWQYGNVWRGYEKNGVTENYVSARTVNYMTKYITKIDEKHRAYKPVILCSPGIGKYYTKTYNYEKNSYNETETNEVYRTSTGHKMAIPIYYRNKRYTDEQREKLWLQKLDKGERWVCGERVDAEDKETYENTVEYHRRRTQELGYRSPEFIWSKKAYEEQRRKMLQEKRLKQAGQIQ